jgi:hypothetical protein
MHSSSRRIPFVILLVLMLLAFIEIGARLLLAYPPVFRRIAGGSDAAWRLDWARRHRSSSPSRYTFDVYHPTRGWALAPDLNGFSMASGKTLTTNSRGLRGGSEFPYQRVIGRQRMLVFGDSFTFGEDVADEETYVHVLGDLLPGAEVLNFGVHGYGLDQMLLYLREEGVKYRPDRVMLGYVDEDIYRDVLTFRDYAKPRFIARTGDSLILQNVPVPPPERFLRWEGLYPRALDLVEVTYQAQRWRSGANRRDSEAISRAILHEVIRTIREVGATPDILYLPVEMELADRSAAPTRGEVYLQSVGVSYFSLRPALSAAVSAGDRQATLGHWPAWIHARAASAIRDHLESGH